MARLSKISVVVPLPSFDIDPLKTFDEDFFDRAVDNILSEEASIEESRDEMMDVDIGISSPFGYDGTSDSSRLSVRRSQRTEAKSPHFSTPSTSASPTTSTAKSLKSRRSSRIRKSVTMDDLTGDDEPPMSLENITQPQHKKEVVEVGHYPIHDAGDPPSALPEMTGAPEIPTHDNEITAEEKIFASVDPEKQMEVMKFIVSHSFMTEQVQPVRRSARRTFTGQVREVAMQAGMNDPAINALIDHVRNTFLEDREIAVANYAGSEFGNEVDGEEETYRKRRKSSTDHSEDKQHKKSKRRHSDKLRRHSHDTLQHDELAEVMEVLEAHVPADVSTEGQDNHYAQLDEHKHKDNTPDLPQLSTNIIQGSPSTFIDLTDSPPHDEVIPESPEPEKVVDTKPFKRRESGKKSKTERNRRKRERKRVRSKHRTSSVEQQQRQDDAVHSAEKQAHGDSIDGKDRIPPSIPRKTSFEGSSGSRRSSGVTPSDEVQSKYFLGAGKPKVSWKSKRETPSSLIELQLLKDFNLPPDFLSSDSSLSDVPSDFASDSLWNDLGDPPSNIHITISPPRSPCLVSQSINPEPETPVKGTSFVNPEHIKTPQAKAPKHSPYFPRVLVDPESCLPFPPIDAPSFGLIQEQLAHDPFRLLIATIFLNRTRGGVALPVLFKVFERYPTIEGMAEADLSELVSMINCLGFQNQRARKCTTLAQTWLSDPPNKSKRYRKLHYPRNLDGRNVGREECIDEEDLRVAWEIAHLPGVGAYSLDSWRIFCCDELRGKASDWKGTDATEVGFVPEWKCVLPHDKELRAYLTWMWLKEGWIWDYNTGDLTLASDKTMRAAQSGGVAREEEGSWVLETSPVKAVNGLHGSD
ncbi:DNA glycosylase [Penicillium concentricum]|uniref:DNA glycosylase n=1 Tax=Penicillium concentricum TaxID=293559 RepID=A0A9W9R944_9EURO|nr:DNA glycosylase [Penicillium concentricum]KAJ5355982.1 DNA glycosylase [Penicillium concentricum]